VGTIALFELGAGQEIAVVQWRQILDSLALSKLCGANTHLFAPGTTPAAP
jgi:hypothetical protein